MVNTEKIVFGEPLYYMPNYGGIIRVSILKLLDNGRLLVKQHSEKKDLKPFPTPIVHICNSNKDASNGRRAWETYMRRQKRESKNDRCR